MGPEKDSFKNELNFLKEIGNRFLAFKENITSLENSSIDEDALDMQKNELKAIKKEYRAAYKNFNQICSFDMEMTLEFIAFVLGKVNDKKYEIVKSDNYYFIKSNDGDEIFSFSVKDSFNIYDKIINNPDCELTRKYPFLTDVFMMLLDYRFFYRNNNKYADEKKLFTFMRLVFDIDFTSCLAKPIKMDSRFTKIAHKMILEAVFEDLDFFKTVYDKEIKSRNELLKFVNKLKKGEYNNLFEHSYWFGTSIKRDVLYKWDKLRSISKNVCALSMENYLVFAKLNEVICHISNIDKKGKYITPVNEYVQTPQTIEEREKMTILKERILSKDYNWREARDIIRNINNFNIYQNSSFPHNIDDLTQCFNVEVLTFFDQVRDEFSLNNEIDNVMNRAKEMIEEIKYTTIKSIFKKNSKNYIDEYLRRMILSQFDIEKIVKANCSENYSETLKKIRDELKAGTNLSINTLNTLFNTHNNSLQDLDDLACGILSSLTNNSKITNILEKCMEIQQTLNYNKGLISPYDNNIYNLPNGEIVQLLPYEDIKSTYNSLLKQYEFYYERVDNLEYIEGCIEIFGDAMMSQIFKEGNKITFICLLNAMLLSRGIIPPIEDNNLWFDVVSGRIDRYPKLRYKLLLETININRQFKEHEIKEPLNLN